MSLGGDNGRFVVAILAAAVGLMGWYWTYLAINAPPGYWAALRDPPAWDHEEVVVTLFEVREIRDGSYLVQKGDRAAWVEGDASDLAIGEDVSVGGWFRASDGRIVETWHERHPLRDGKRAYGLLGVVALLALLPVWFRYRDGRLVIVA